jgi:electron transfer flavoprotein beta subunit
VVNIIVCIKEIIDPEIQLDNFAVSPSEDRIVGEEKLARVLNPNDGQAVEAALRIKDADGSHITVLSLGKGLHREIVKKPLAMGTDELILLEDEAYEGGDSWSTGKTLAHAIKAIGDYDIVLCGRQAADWDSGQVGLIIAEILGLPSVTTCRKIQAVDGKAMVEQVAADGYQVIEVSLPAVIMVSNELGQPRYATIQKTLEVVKVQPRIWKPEDIGISTSETGKHGSRLKLVRLFQPVRENNCEIIAGDSAEEVGLLLAQRLREEKLL